MLALGAMACENVSDKPSPMPPFTTENFDKDFEGDYKYGYATRSMATGVALRSLRCWMPMQRMVSMRISIAPTIPVLLRARVFCYTTTIASTSLAILSV